MVEREGIGHVIPPGDRDQLRARILELHEDGEARQRMGAAARCALEARYSPEAGFSAYRRVLEMLP
jgi:glycosyltransferase involved in cell wall biosynthesis